MRDFKAVRILRFLQTVSRIGTVTVAVLATFPPYVHAASPPSHEDVEVVAWADVPQMAQHEIMRAGQNHPIGTVKRRATARKISYETTVMIGSTPWFIKVAPDGELLQRTNLSEPAPRPSHRPHPRAVPRATPPPADDTGAAAAGTTETSR
jgi:hypothetical protein